MSETPDTVFRGRIGILGTGALGAFYGARLFQAGHDVHFLMRRDFEVVRSNGLHVKSIDGDFHISPPVYRSAEDLGPCDLLIIGLKSTDNAVFRELLKPTLGPQTLVLTLQNGLGNEEAIAAAMSHLGFDTEHSHSHVLGGVAFLCSNRIAPGVIDHMAHGWIRMAEFQGAGKPRTHSLAQLFRTSRIECHVYDSLLLARWEKLVWNIPFNGLGVAARAHTATILADDMLSKTTLALMDEVVTAATSDGVALDAGLPNRMFENTRAMGEYRTSMQIDFEEGRPLEVEAIIGEPLRRATRAGISVPRLEMLYSLVRHAGSMAAKHM